MVDDCRIEGWVAAEPSAVFAAFTQPELLDQWNSRSCVDLRVGGRYSNADGDTGVYHSIVPGRELVFSWDNPDHAPGTTVAIRLEKKGRCTQISITHYDLIDSNQREDLSRSWQWAIDCVKSLLETGRVFTFADWAKRRQV